jgi:hypothetical protein
MAPSPDGVRLICVVRLSDNAPLSTTLSPFHTIEHTELLSRLLAKSPWQDKNRIRVTAGDSDVLFEKDSQCAYLAIVRQGYPLGTGFTLLSEVAREFGSVLDRALSSSKPSSKTPLLAQGAGLAAVPALSLSKPAERVILPLLTRYSDVENVDKLAKIQAEVDRASNKMQDNIVQVLANKEKVDVLEDKARDLEAQAKVFDRRATSLKRTMWWKNCKMWLACFLVMAFVIGVVLLLMMVIFKKKD